MTENITSSTSVRRPAEPAVLNDPVQAVQDAIWQPAYPDPVS